MDGPVGPLGTRKLEPLQTRCFRRKNWCLEPIGFQLQIISLYTTMSHERDTGVLFHGLYSLDKLTVDSLVFAYAKAVQGA